MPELPDKFRFSPDFLDSYKPGMMFPHICFMENGQYGLKDKSHPLSRFMEWYANLGNAHQGDFGDPHQDWLEQKACMESLYLDSLIQEEGYVVFAKPREYLEQHGCIGAIEVYKQLEKQITSAIDYCRYLGMQQDSFPLSGLSYYRTQITDNIKNFETRKKGLKIEFIE